MPQGQERGHPVERDVDRRSLRYGSHPPSAPALLVEYIHFLRAVAIGLAPLARTGHPFRETNQTFIGSWGRTWRTGAANPASPSIASAVSQPHIVPSPAVPCPSDTGLLDGQAATTHWAFADLFARCFPAVDLAPDRILVSAGPDRRSSAGSGRPRAARRSPRCRRCESRKPSSCSKPRRRRRTRSARSSAKKIRPRSGGCSGGKPASRPAAAAKGFEGSAVLRRSRECPFENGSRGPLSRRFRPAPPPGRP